ncbi:hypothetical protein KKH23_05150 [Patescibacteria group bacterium]|nr:hypothetical protein [Patescibacteria group bacterium]
MNKRIKGISTDECYKRLKDHGVNEADAEILIREYKNGDLIHIDDNSRMLIQDYIDEMVKNKDNYSLLENNARKVRVILSKLGISESDIDYLMNRD